MTKKRSQSLAERLIKNSRNTAYQLDKSPVYADKEIVSTDFPLLNVAWSGSVKGGYEEGKITTFAGPSKHGKTFLSFVSAKAFQDKYEDGIILFFDIEYGTPMDYLEGIGIDLDRMVHVPITNLEELKFDIVNQLNNLQEGDKVCIVLDSLSNTPSKKELEDTLSEKSTADMTRAREAKSLFRMITPLLAKHKVPMFVITHVYQSMDFISKAVVSGGQGIYYSSHNIFMLGRQQIKEGKDIVGWNFVLNVEKGRDVKEKSKFLLEVHEDTGINRFSGLLDIGEQTGFIIRPSQGWYSRVNPETGEVEDKKWRAKDTQCDEFWEEILNNPLFDEKVQKIYKYQYQ